MTEKLVTFENIDSNLIAKWQKTADLIAEIISVPAALIMKTEDEFMEVLVSSKTEKNPYHAGDREEWSGLYCETVIKTQSELLVPDATADPRWNKNPDIKLGMIAYLGYPINFPDNRPFGTLCVLDNKEKAFSPLHKKLLSQLRDTIEMDLVLIQKDALRNHSNETMLRRLEYDKLLHEVSTIALAADDLVKFYDRCLSLVGERLGVSRTYFFKYNEATDTMDNTHEWCAKGILPQKEELQGIPGSVFSWWLEILRRNDIICYPDIENIPDEATRELLSSQDIKSILVVPFFVNGKFYGFLGFDDCDNHRDWQQEDVEVLLSLSRIISIATESKQMEKLLKEEREQLLSIFNGIDESIYIVDPTTYEVLFVNSFLKKMLDKDFPEKKCYEQFQGFNAPCEFCTNQIILENPEEVYRWEYYNPNLNRHYLLSDRIIKWTDGRDVRFEMAIDITDRIEAEEEKEKLQSQFLQAQKMESVGQLAGGVAHDFNNMLTVILGHTEIALMKTNPDQPIYKNLEEIRKSAERSANLTRQLLTFARKQTIAPRIIDLNETVEGMVQMLRQLIGEGVDLSWLPGKNLAQVKVDPAQIDQILVNLCVNARDAIDGVGKITIETELVTFDEDYCAVNLGFVPGDFVMLAVSDNGCGMEPEVISHLFEPFFTTKKLGKGTGLGLSSVYGAVKQNNGFIKVYSEPNQGTTFKIYLPQHSSATPIPTEKVTEKPNKRGSETILLVEDEPDILNLVMMMLEEMGYEVIVAKTPGEAIRLANEHSGSIDLLMTDVVMPEMNGRELAKNILSIYPGIKRLFMSGYTSNVIAHHGVLDEGVCFIQKPFSSKSLGLKLREVLEDSE